MAAMDRLLLVCTLVGRLVGQSASFVLIHRRVQTMLAPRKKLWSTPTAAIDVTARLIELTSSDVLFDVGCGDARVIIRLAATTPCRHFVGIEIDEDRAKEAENNVERAEREGGIPKGTNISIRRENAMEVDYSEATCVFLYLVPRGLRLIKPVLLSCRRGDNGNDDGIVDNNRESRGSSYAPLRVVTYMAGFTDQSYAKKETCTVDHQEGSAWPIYLYHLDR